MGWKLPVVLARDGDRTLQKFVDDLYGPSQVLRETLTLAPAAMNPGMFERYAMTYTGFHWSSIGAFQSDRSRNQYRSRTLCGSSSSTAL